MISRGCSHLKLGKLLSITRGYRGESGIPTPRERDKEKVSKGTFGGSRFGRQGLTIVLVSRSKSVEREKLINTRSLPSRGRNSLAEGHKGGGAGGKAMREKEGSTFERCSALKLESQGRAGGKLFLNGIRAGREDKLVLADIV